MIEEEARVRICCGPLHSDAEFIRCRGSECMAWRWGPKKKARAMPAFDAEGRSSFSTQTEPARPKDIPDDWMWRPGNGGEELLAGWYEPKAETDKRREGWCGLAGKP